MTDLRATLTENEGEDVRRLDPLHPIWEIRGPGLLARNKKDRLAKVVACRSAVWRALLSSGRHAFLRHHEPPGEYEVPGSWEPHGGNTWMLPAGFNPAERNTSSWLSLGEWMGYAAAAPLDETPGLFAMAPERVVEWAVHHQVAVAIDSFSDDAEWRVFVRAAE